jgi:hypothetical protein
MNKQLVLPLIVNFVIRQHAHLAERMHFMIYNEILRCYFALSIEDIERQVFKNSDIEKKKNNEEKN